MATKVSDSIAESIVDLITGTDHWLALNTGDPGETGANESTVTGRVELDTTAGWDAAEDDTTTGGRKQVNAAELDFGDATGSATLSHWSIWTASTAGTFVIGGSLTASQAVVSGNPVKFPAGAFEIVGAGGS